LETVDDPNVDNLLKPHVLPPIQGNRGRKVSPFDDPKANLSTANKPTIGINI